MSRPLRLDHAGAVWHVTSRGNERKTIYVTAADRDAFLQGLQRVVRRWDWRVHAFVLMGNHYHLLVETRAPTLSRGMRDLNGAYAQRFNRTHGRCGHVFQSRFTAILVEKEAHLLELIRYVVLNPVRAALVRKPEQWEWSSYRSTAGLTRVPDWLNVEWTRSQFGSGSAAVEAYRRFVAERVPEGSPLKGTIGQIYLGGESFRARVRERIGRKAADGEFPRTQRLPPTVDALVAATAREFQVTAAELRERRPTEARMAFAYLAQEVGRHRLVDFAPRLGVGKAAASRLSRAAEARLQTCPAFRRAVERARRALLRS